LLLPVSKRTSFSQLVKGYPKGDRKIRRDGSIWRTRGSSGKPGKQP
jgi:hypothetical protein